MSAVLPKSGNEHLLASFFTAEVATAVLESAVAGLKRLPKRGLEVGGILTCRSVATAPLRVDGMVPIASEYRFGPSLRLSAADLIQLLDQSEQIRASGAGRIAGFWRSAIDGTLSYTTDDLDILRDIFPESQLLLIVKPSAEGQTLARMFQPDEAGVWTPAGDFELAAPPAFGPTRPPVLRPAAAIERARVPPPHTLTKEPEVRPSPIPAKVASATGRGKMRNLVILVTLFLFSAAVSATWFLMQSRRPTPVPRNSGKDLGIQVEHVGTSLRISWNTRSNIVQSARGGVLLVDDGPQHRQFILDAGQVSNGYILYTPASGDVTFRLEVPDLDRQLIVETVRVLDGSRDLSPAAGNRSVESAQRASPPAPNTPGTLADPRTGKQIVARTPPSSDTPVAPPAVEASKPVFQAQILSVTPRVREARPISEPPPPLASSAESASTVTLPALKDSFDPGPPPKETTPRPEASRPPAPASAAVLTSGQNAIPPPVSAVAIHLEPSTTATLALTPAKFEPPKPIRQVMPNKNQFGPSVIYGPTEVQVIVSVDASGNVKDARTINNKQPGRNMLLTTQAIAAAKEWKFEPARVNGKRAEGSFTIVFQFAPKS